MSWSSIAENIRIFTPVVTSIVTSVTAVFAYKMGREYFNRGQSNTLYLEHYKRELDAILGLQSNLNEMKRLIDGLLSNQIKTIEHVEGFLRQLANQHSKTSESSHKAMFIKLIGGIRTSYYEWYDTWLVNAEGDMTLISLGDPNQRDKTLARIRQPLTAGLDTIIANLESLKASLKPNLNIES